MCGITGILHQHRTANKQELDALTLAITSRGPDAQGTWIDGNHGIGHRRLSIIDLEDGQQPMFSADGRYGIVFNGEIYNYKALKKELEQKGHQFKTHSDTEVLLYAYIQWQEKCLNKLRGMFAFAIVDKPKNMFFLARDHMGIKPLVYYHTKDTFAFASEIRALKKIEDANFTLDVSAIDEYLWLQYIPAPKTIFNEVKKIKPAHYMTVSFDGEITQESRYWDLDFAENKKKTESQWLDELDHVLRESVKAHLVADVPFGAFLSGGIDSSLIVKYMSEVLDAPVETFSMGFKEEEFNELGYAQQAAEKYKTNHHEEIVTPDALSILPDLVKHYGEPFGDSSAVPTYYVSKLARSHVPMVLSGDGADEIFAGYSSYKSWMQYLEKGDSASWLKKQTRPARAALGAVFPKKFPPKLAFGDGLENWYPLMRYLPPQGRLDLWKKDLHPQMVSEIGAFEEAFEKTGQLSALSRVQYLDINTYLPYDILAKVDIASMMHGLEARTPFVDKDVYEFATTIPNDMNFANVDGHGVQGKNLLKQILGKDMPKDYVYRKKMGFAMPIKSWFQDDGAFYGELNEKLLSPNSMLFEYFNADAIRKIIEIKHYGVIWLLLFLEEWLSQNKA